MYSGIFLKVAKQLFPKGRAYKMPPATDSSPPRGGNIERLMKVLSANIADAHEAVLSIFDSALPDNPNFTEDDATDWERRLGIYSAPGTTLEDRILAIRFKMNFPGTVSARQTAAYIQDSLQAAGFDVYVTENRFLEGSPPIYVTKTPSEVYGDAAGESNLGNFSLGETNLGSQWIDDGITIIANYIEEEKDAGFGFGDTLRSIFYISTPFVAGFASFANVPAVRKTEFRQLILQLKPLQSVGVLFINYV